jgi:hypothetical protein
LRITCRAVVVLRDDGSDGRVESKRLRAVIAKSLNYDYARF